MSSGTGGTGRRFDRQRYSSDLFDRLLPCLFRQRAASVVPGGRRRAARRQCNPDRAFVRPSHMLRRGGGRSGSAIDCIDPLSRRRADRKRLHLRRPDRKRSCERQVLLHSRSFIHRRLAAIYRQGLFGIAVRPCAFRRRNRGADAEEAAALVGGDSGCRAARAGAALLRRRRRADRRNSALDHRVRGHGLRPG